MDIPDDLKRFRNEVRTFVRDNLPENLRVRVTEGCYPRIDELKGWIGVLARRGWSAPSWPKEHGGAGLSPIERAVFDEECALADAPAIEALGLSVIGPAIIAFGTEDQKNRLLPGIISGGDYWCQGFSEPGSGSDLASLSTRAIKDGDHYVVNGSKIWTSDAHVADRMLCLVRTDPDAPKHRGISALLIDMDTPGITVRPIPWMNGIHGFNEVFFDDVRVPVERLLGAENRGWDIAKHALVPERIYVSRVAENKRLLKRLRQAMEGPGEDGRPQAENPVFAGRAARLEIRLLALEERFNQFLTDMEAGREVGPEVSMLKLTGSRLIQSFEELIIEAYGPATMPFDAEMVASEGANLKVGMPNAAMAALRHFHHRGYTIGGGTSEVQREVLARRVLNL